MPIRVLILGLLYILGGGQALLEMLGGTPDGPVLNLAVVLLPIGIGLLLGKPWALLSAKVVIYFAFGVILFAVIGGTIDSESASVRINGVDYSGSEAVPYLWYVGVGFGVVLFVLLRLLKSDVTRAHFEPKSPNAVTE